MIIFQVMKWLDDNVRYLQGPPPEHDLVDKMQHQKEGKEKRPPQKRITKRRRISLRFSSDLKFPESTIRRLLANKNWPPSKVAIDATDLPETSIADKFYLQQREQGVPLW